MIKLYVVLGILVVLAFSILGSAYVKGEREEMRAAVAKECLESGGKYHETMFRRRPVCKR